MTTDQRIDDLEWRLLQYHEWLVASIEERDRLALDAAWGVHNGLFQIIAAVFILINAYFAIDAFPWWVVAVVIGLSQFPIQAAIHAWSNKGRMKDMDLLAKLPEWEFKG